MIIRPVFGAARTRCRVDRFALAFAFAVTLVGCKKKDERPDDPVPPRNIATLDVVHTELGTGLAIRTTPPPTSVQWERVVVLDDDRAVLLGRENNQSWMLRTQDRGRTWNSASVDAQPWVRWGIAMNGAVAMVSGSPEPEKAKPRGGAASKLPPAIAEGSLWYVGTADRQFDGPRGIFPNDAALAGASVPSGLATPALFDDAVSLLVEKNRAPMMAFAPVTGTSALEPMVLEKQAYVSVPYGRPPKLLTLGRGVVELRNWPRPGEALGVATPVPNYRSDTTTLAQLSEGPSCDAGTYSFKRLGTLQPWVVGISGERALAFKLPSPDVGGLGCAEDAIVAEVSIVDPSDSEKGRKVPQLVRCGLDGKCSEPKAPPFAIWNDKHEQKIWSVPTKHGLVAVLRERTAARWGLYFGQSSDGGASFELPRTIGEGVEGRGNLEFGALLRFGERLVLLLSADVGSTGRRGWYVLASDDEGNHWGTP